MGQQFKGDNLQDSPGLEMTLSGSGLVLTRQEKTRQFLIGFFGWWLVSLVLWGGSAGILGFLLFPANIIVLLVLGSKRRWVALGMLVAIAANLLVSLMLGLGINALCFIPFPIK